MTRLGQECPSLGLLVPNGEGTLKLVFNLSRNQSDWVQYTG